MGIGEMSAGMSIMFSLITGIIMIPLSALALFLSGKIFKKDIKFRKALIPAIVIFVVSFAINILGTLSGSLVIIAAIGVLSFLVGVTLYLTLPKFLLGLEWKDSLLIGLIWFGIMLVVGLIVGIISAIVGVIIGLKAAGI